MQPPFDPARSPGPRRQPALPRLDLLHSFEAVARTLSFTLAAQELFLTQSAVSRRIAQLESELGAPLFVRRNRAIDLTEAGQILQLGVVECFERLREVTARLHALRPSRQVTISTTPGFASLWLIPRLEHFVSSHPGVDVRVSATNEVQSMDRLGIDLAVRFSMTASGHGSPLFEETVLPVCSPRLLAQAQPALLRPADLINHTLLSADSLSGAAPTADWSVWIELMRLPALRAKSMLRLTSYADVIAAALAGQGVAIGRLPLIADLLASGQLLAPFGEASSTRSAYFLVRSARIASNPDAERFASWLECEARLGPAGIIGAIESGSSP